VFHRERKVPEMENLQRQVSMGCDCSGSGSRLVDLSRFGGGVMCDKPLMFMFFGGV
jgi:hypothetical protein